MFWKSQADIAKAALIESLKRENLFLQTQVSDLQSQLNSLFLQAYNERQQLLDRFTNLVAPQSKPRTPRPAPMVEDFASFPGYRPDLTPLDPTDKS